MAQPRRREDLQIDAYNAVMPIGLEGVELVRFIQQEFQRIERTFLDYFDAIPQLVHVEPEFPRRGMIRFADGTNWNPGDGAGLYVFTGTRWAVLATETIIPAVGVEGLGQAGDTTVAIT